MIFRRKDINEVFTPRSSAVNSGMYIQREELEKDLYRSTIGSMHTFVYGESGNGKSWLYKKVFNDKNINHVIANCANASRKKSVTDEIYSACIKEGQGKKVGYKDTKKAGVSAIGKAELSHQNEYDILQEDDLLLAFRALNKKSKGKKSVIVLDNVETIFDNQELMNELSDIIILLDDTRYAQYQVKFLIVGIPNKVIQYFSTAKNPTSVGNRIEEIQRVAGLEYLQVFDLVERGFDEYLKIDIPDLQKKRLARHIFEITIGVPQRIHEYCECLAYIIEDNDWVYDHELLEKADTTWLLKGLRESYTLIQKHLNAEATSDGRRNQVIYAIGKHSNHLIDTNRIGSVIEREFPKKTPESKSGIGQILASLSKGNNPLLNKIKNSNSYEISDPRYLMCIRIMLYKHPLTESILIKGFTHN